MSIYSPLIIRALELAAQWHIGQFRKHPSEQIPYIAHPTGVGFMLQKAGCDDETIAAGILHDVIEDCGVTQEEVAVAMNPRVAELVAWVSEPLKPASWEERKAAYREKMLHAPIEALNIAAADHAYNLRGMLTIAGTSDDMWRMFNADRVKRIAHEQEVLRIIASRTASPAVEAFAEALHDVMKLPA
jgi:(p)ppGpp synthase/HD superfamily hydrolase